jgi:DNA-binding IclR family transcriptional regulator
MPTFHEAQPRLQGETLEKTVVKALRVLETLAASDRPRSVAELAEALELSKSNVYRLLDTLHEADYVSRVNGRNTFELSLKMWHLGAKVTARLDIKTAALPYLSELRDKTQETARLTVLHGHHGVCIEQVETEHPMRVQTPIGGALLLYCSATGKAMLAYQSHAFVEEVAASLQAFMPATLPPKEALLAELTQIRKDGFAINRGERVSGVCGVAAPIFNSRGTVTASIGISGPIARLNYRTLRNAGPLVRDVARRLSHDLGARVD